MIDISPIQILIVLVIALVVFGPRRLPEIGRTVGRGVREFRGAVSLSGDAPTAPGPRAGATSPAHPDVEDDVLEGIVVPGETPPSGSDSHR